VKHERATEEIRELAALYALGSLTQHEARSFEIHMREGCGVCENEYRKFARTIAELGFASEEVPAPDYIRDLLLARVERERGAAATAGNKIKAQKTEIPQKTPMPPPAAPFLHSRPRREKPHIVPWVLAFLLLALAVASYFLWKTFQDETRQLQAKLTAARMDADELKKQIEEHAKTASRLEQITAAMRRPETRIARLIGQAAAPNHAGAVLWDTKAEECLIIGAFDATPQGKVYQLWFFSPTQKIPVGLIHPDAQGRVFTTLRVPEECAGATAVVVTLEPDNGSQIPTAPYCAAGRID